MGEEKERREVALWGGRTGEGTGGERRPRFSYQGMIFFFISTSVSSDFEFVQIKKHGKQGDISEFHAQLDALGLKIFQVTADGNCFFRALADQVEGNEEEHQRYRSMVAQFILDNNPRDDMRGIACMCPKPPSPDDCTNNREMFEPFIEDDVSFDEYCQSMEKDGTWAGNMELQAASLVTRTNICIHRNMSPRWYIRNFESHEARMVHLSYHDGEHYNSVRLKEDTSNGPARPIIIKADADLSALSCKAKAALTKSKGGAGKNVIHADSIKLVMAGSGCEDAKKVEQILRQVGGDVDAANEFLIAEQATADYLAESDKLSCLADTSHGGVWVSLKCLVHELSEFAESLARISQGGLVTQMRPISGRWPDVRMLVNTLDLFPSGIFENGNYEQQTEELKDNSCMSEQSCDKETTHDSESSHKDEKKIARNKVCPCGSKKKYKACCGSVSGRSSKFTIIQTVDYSKSRKDRKQGKKSGSKDVANSRGGEGAPDVGALCI
ncbi:hypothetical protein RHSIM_Rhsim08G0099200 [Rhododendron simsii]|uniref:OTU domain-containing protein n=1 Tax=Rhododendron simsii TaxID=118357 RepID=A0A834GNP0_RHOSS|nr:hypothetical protein RHSIM_Rhsim08G0099200 [Rhododendron simsii]